jgi:hypothetical protein
MSDPVEPEAPEALPSSPPVETYHPIATATLPKTAQLTIRERRFIQEYVKGFDYATAYDKAFPVQPGKSGRSREVSSANGRRVWERIRPRIEFRELLEHAGLGNARLAHELQHRLSSTKVNVHYDEKLGTFKDSAPHPDNGTRMEGTKLLARVLGAEITREEVNIKALSAQVLIPAKATVDDWLAQAQALKNAPPTRPQGE